MAQTSKKKPAASRSKTTANRTQSTASTKPRSSTAKPASRTATAAAAKRPYRREVAAGICFLLGIYSFIGYFDSEAVFIRFFTDFVKRFIGNGFFILPPALIMCSVILAFHKGYPVLLRVISTLSLTAVAGALWHAFASPIMVFVAGEEKYEMSFSMFGTLWADSVLLKSGGVVSGSISQVFLTLFGLVGTVISFIIIAAILAMIAFNATVSGIIGAFAGREKLQYEVEEYEAAESEEDFDRRAIEQAHREHDRRKHRYPLIPWGRKKAIDIPLDERRTVKKDFFADDPKSELYNKTPGAKPPDEVLKDNPPPEIAGEGVIFGVEQSSGSDGTRRNDEDMPFDIPFIDETWNAPPRHPPVTPPIENVSFLGDTGTQTGFINQAALTNENAPPVDTTLPSDVIEQVTHPKKRHMPAVPEPEGAEGGESSNDKSGSAATFSAGDVEMPDIQYKFPPLNLLSQGDPRSRAGDTEVSQNSDRLESAFQSFGINVNITNATRGPSVTRYEAELEAGIKLSRLTGLSDDIALALGTVGVRIAAMPNKISTVGIEVPNKSISKVHLRDVIESSAFQDAKSALTFAIGMDISGFPIVGEISKLPHMLVAGTTGSGKSVCLNSIILSILYKATPKEVRFIMIDPKMVEFKVYNSIPHLLVPVVTDVKKSAGALQWATFEMMKRYNLFSETNARDLEGYNKIANSSNEEREPLPQVVVVIDELADLMMTAAKEVEESVCRIAQMGRAAGIHLIIATQSPRANVITGLMKANIPSRIAFRVASALESQIILDPGQNADKLVGNGDMLYSPIGAAKPMRLQGTWVSDKEREKVVDFIKNSGDTQYSEEVMYEIEKAASDKSSGGGPGGNSGGDADADSEHDELLAQAVDVFFEAGQASTSLLQRRLRLGYARAARIVDQMEELGIIGQYEGSKSRTLLITRDQWRQMQYISGTAPADTPRSSESGSRDGSMPDTFPTVTSVGDE